MNGSTDNGLNNGQRKLCPALLGSMGRFKENIKQKKEVGNLCYCLFKVTIPLDFKIRMTSSLVKYLVIFSLDSFPTHFAVVLITIPKHNIYLIDVPLYLSPSLVLNTPASPTTHTLPPSPPHHPDRGLAPSSHSPSLPTHTLSLYPLPPVLSHSDQ